MPMTLVRRWRGVLPAAALCGCLSLPPWISLSEAPVDFGQVAVGGQSAPRILQVSNIGDAVTGPLNCTIPLETSGFHINCDACAGRRLEPGEACEVSITFRPTLNGPAFALARFDAEPGRQKFLQIQGTGLEETPGFSRISTPDESPPADGVTRLPVTVTAVSNTLDPVEGVKVFLTSSDPTDLLEHPAALTDANGEATGFIAATRAGLRLVGARFPTGELLLRSLVTFSATPVAADASTLAATTPQTVADGQQSAPVLVTVRDLFGRAVPDAAVTLEASGSGTELVQPPPTRFDGTTTGFVRSTVPETKTVTASVGGVRLDAAVALSFVPGPPDALLSRVTVTPERVDTASGPGTAAIEVWLADAMGTPLEGRAVTLSAEVFETWGTSTLTQPPPTGADGYTAGAITAQYFGPRRVTVSVEGVPLWIVQPIFGTYGQ